MKVLHVPYGYYPDPVGGTEVYVHRLAKQLAADGLENVIAAPARVMAHYEHDGLRVRRFGTRQNGVRLEDLYGLGDAAAAEQFGRILDAERPPLVHLHAFSMAVSIRLLHEAKRRGCRVVFTYHTPTVSCIRGTLLRDGKRVCEGRLDPGRCNRCFAKRWGAILGLVAGHVPRRMGSLLGALGLQGGIWTALRCRQLVALRLAAVRHLCGETQRMIAPCHWVRELLIRNGAPADKIVLCRQGVVATTIDQKADKSEPRQPIRPLRAVFLGRMDPTKGSHRLVEVFRQTPGLMATLDIYGVAQDAAGAVYEKRLKAAAAGDRRLMFHAPIPEDRVTRTLVAYDVLVVPSEVMETGPLVVLEAFATGTPVIGSNLGGIAELVHDGVDGLLVPPGAVEAWSAALQRCASEAGLLDRLRSGIRPPRTMADVAGEVHEVYKSVL